MTTALYILGWVLCWGGCYGLIRWSRRDFYRKQDALMPAVFLAVSAPVPVFQWVMLALVLIMGTVFHLMEK